MWLTDFATPEDEEDYMDFTTDLKTNTVTYTKPVTETVGNKNRWRSNKPFTDNIEVFWQGFESDTKFMLTTGWTIDLETNRFTHKHKLCFKHKANGLMARIPFNLTDKKAYITCLYAVSNYKIKASRFTETVQELTEDVIPELLEWICEVKRSKVAEFVWNQKKQEEKQLAKDMGLYTHNQD